MVVSRDCALLRITSLGFALLVGMALLLVVPTFGALAAESEEPIGGHRFIDLFVTVTFDDGVDTQSITATETITVKRIVGVEVSNPEDEDYDWRYIYPEASTEFTVTVKNTGNDLDHFVVSLEGLPSGWQAEVLHDGSSLVGELTLAQGDSQTVVVRLTAPARGSGNGDGVVEGDQAEVRLNVASWAVEQSWYDGPQNASEAMSGAMRVEIVDAELLLHAGDAVATDPSDHENKVQVTYSASVTNNGTGDAENFVWIHPVPEVLDWDTISIDVDGGVGCAAVFDSVAGNITVECESVAPGDTVTLTFEIEVPPHTKPGELPTPPMTVTYEDTADNAFEIQANIQPVTINVYYSLSIEITGIKLNDGSITHDVRATRGDKVTLVAFVRNEGNVLDAYSIYLDNTHDKIAWAPKQQGTNHAEPDDGFFVEFVTTLSGEVADGDVDQITLTAFSHETEGAFTAQTSETLLIVLPVIHVSLTGDNVNPFPGDAVVLTLTIENVGGYAANELEVQAPIPEGATYQAGSLTVDQPGWNTVEDSDELLIGPGVLESGDTLIVTYTVVIDEWSM